jgi:copper(I)-binding protein
MWIGVVLLALGCGSRGKGATAAAGELRVTHAVGWGLPEDSAGTVGFRLENRGTHADTLAAATSTAAKVTMHDVVPEGRLRRMVRIDRVAVPAGSTMVFGTGRQHLMLADVAPEVWTRDTIPLELRFSSGERLRLSVPVLRVTEALEELEGR